MSTMATLSRWWWPRACIAPTATLLKIQNPQLTYTPRGAADTTEEYDSRVDKGARQDETNKTRHDKTNKTRCQKTWAAHVHTKIRGMQQRKIRYIPGGEKKRRKKSGRQEKHNKAKKTQGQGAEGPYLKVLHQLLEFKQTQFRHT